MDSLPEIGDLSPHIDSDKKNIFLEHLNSTSQSLVSFEPIGTSHASNEEKVI